MFIYYPIKIVFTVRRVYKKCYIIKIKSFVYYCTNERNLRMKVLNKSYFSNLSINKSGYLIHVIRHSRWLQDSMSTTYWKMCSHLVSLIKHHGLFAHTLCPILHPIQRFFKTRLTRKSGFTSWHTSLNPRVLTPNSHALPTSIQGVF
jgi:hypothetical protein